MVSRAAILMLAVVACGAVWGPRIDAPTHTRVLLRQDAPALRGETRDAPEGVEPGLAAFLAHATPDDVARGVNALRERAVAEAPELTPAQEAALRDPSQAGRAARAARDRLRTQRRLAESAWLEAASRVVAARPAAWPRAGGSAP
jgi:hypothetical protein